MDVSIFTFGPFQENTYILFDASKECIIIDPGCSNTAEQNLLTDFISSSELKPVRLVNTHCHIDHVLGNKFVSEKYNLPLESHKGEIPVLQANTMVAKMYGIPYEESPPIEKYIEEGDLVSFGETTLETLFTPGHSPASISFFNKEARILIAGDVLFQRSIGRTDLPGGDFDTLIGSIKQKFYPLGDDVTVYPGHGPSTTIGEEKAANPFLLQQS